MKVFGNAIHGTRVMAPYRTGKYAYKIVNLFCLYEEGEKVLTDYVVKFKGQACRFFVVHRTV